MLSTIWTWTQLWSLMPRRREALTADTCQSALMWSLALTASSNCSRRRLPRVGARTRTSASASRGGIAGSGLPELLTARLEQHAFPEPTVGDLEWCTEPLRRRLEDQQPGRN